MITNIKNPLLLLLAILLLAGQLETVFAAAINGISGHVTCSMDMKPGMANDQNEVGISVHSDKQHQCNEERCTHSICASTTFSMNSNPVQTLPYYVDSKISTVYSLSVETFPTSLYRPPRA